MPRHGQTAATIAKPAGRAAMRAELHGTASKLEPNCKGALAKSPSCGLVEPGGARTLALAAASTCTGYATSQGSRGVATHDNVRLLPGPGADVDG